MLKVIIALERKGDTYTPWYYCQSNQSRRVTNYDNDMTFVFRKLKEWLVT